MKIKMKTKKDLVDRKKVLKIVEKYIEKNAYNNMPKGMLEFYKNMIDDKGLKFTLLALCNGSVYEVLNNIMDKIESLKNEN